MPLPSSKLPPELREQIAIELHDLLDRAATAGDDYQLSKRRFRLLLAEHFGFDKLRCTMCRLWKDRADYNRNGSKKRGLDYVCRECRVRYYNVKEGIY